MTKKKEEAQELACILLDAEVKIGELLREIPQATAGRPSLASEGSLIHTRETDNLY